MYYSRPGPGNYEIKENLGERAVSAKRMNSPSYKIAFPKQFNYRRLSKSPSQHQYQEVQKLEAM